MAYPRILFSGSSVTDATSHATTSQTPVNANVYTVYCANTIAAGTATLPTPSGTNGWNGTFTQIATVTRDQIRLTVWRVTAVSSVAGTITFDYSGTTNSSAAYGIDRWTDVDSPLNVQSGTTAADNATSITLSPALSTFASQLNGTYAVLAGTGNFITVRGDNTQGAMCQITQASITSAEVNAASFYCAGEVTAPQFTCSGAGSDLVLVAVEVDNSLSAGASSGTQTFLPTFRV